MEAMSAQAEVEEGRQRDTLSRSGYKAQRGTGAAAAGSVVEPLLRPAQLAFTSR